LPDGLSQEFAAASCKDIKLNHPESPSGNYWVFSHTTSFAFQVYCEMDTNGGGWTRFLQNNGDVKNCQSKFSTVPLDQEVVGDYCAGLEYSFSRSMMLASAGETLTIDSFGGKMQHRFFGCQSYCRCDMFGVSASLCFFLGVTGDYLGQMALDGVEPPNYDYNTVVEAWDWADSTYYNAGNGHCGGTNANSHSQWNCEPSQEGNWGERIGMRYHYGVRDVDGVGSIVGETAEGDAWGFSSGYSNNWAANSLWMYSLDSWTIEKVPMDLYFR